MAERENFKSEEKLSLALTRAGDRPETVERDFAVDQPEEVLSIRHALHVVRRDTFLILATVALAIGFRAWQLSKVVPTYVAQSTVRFNDSRSNLTATRLLKLLNQ